MSDPTRLLDEGATDFERELLGSWRDEQPSDRARRRALALAGAAATVTASTTATATVASSLAPKATLALVTAKWLGVGVLAGLATSAVALQFSAGPAHAPASSRVLQIERAPLPPPPALAPPSPAASVAAPPSATALAAPRSSPVTPSRGTLGPETVALDQARAALKSGNAAKTLELVQRYQHDFPGGVLAQEAEVLRIDALARAGNRAAAAAEARRFLSAHPQSPHAERLRVLAGDATNP